jgi:hypothetical protein
MLDRTQALEAGPPLVLENATMFVIRFRYRTRVLIGPWRATREEANADAADAGQVVANAPPASQDWWIEQEDRNTDVRTKWK